MQYVIEGVTRFLIAGADSPERALEWFVNDSDIDVDVSPLAYGRLRVVGTVGDHVAPVQLLEPGSYQAWRAEHVQSPPSRLQRFAERYAAALRPVVSGHWGVA